MKDKITYLMKSEGLTTTRLAEILGVRPSSVSHLVSGRNKPGYDILQKILRCFPRVNPDWLLLDSDEYYRSDLDDELQNSSMDDLIGANVDSAPDNSLFTRNIGQYSSNKSVSGASESDNKQISMLNTATSGSKNPIFVVVFYEDGSCEKFSMPR